MPVSRPVRRAWLWAGSAVAVALLGWGTVEAVSEIAYERETIVDVDTQPGLAAIEVRNGHGSIEVTGTSRAAATVEARLTHGLRGPEHGLRREGDRLVVWGDCPVVLAGRCGISFRIEAPSGVAVLARSEHGDVVLRDLRGDVDAATEHGDVEASGIRGALRLHTDHGDATGTGLSSRELEARSEHGDVHLELEAPPRAVRVLSEHGSVEVLLPATRHAYRVEASSDHGTARTTVRTDPFSERSVAARSEHGDVSVRYRSVGAPTPPRPPPAPPAGRSP